MMKKRLSKKIWYGSDVDTEGNPVLPPLAIDSDDLEGLHYGELYLHIADDKLSLWTRTLTDQVKQIGGSGSGDGELWQLRQTDAGDPYLFSPFDVAVQRGLTSFVDGGSLDLPSIYDGLPIDNQTLYWEEVTEEVGTDEEGKPIYETTKVLKAADVGTGGGVADSVHWDNIEGKPSWIGSTKPSYSYSEISDTPDLSQYATSDKLDDYLPLSGELPSSMSSEFKLQGDLRLQKGTGASGRKILFGDGLNTYLYESPDNFLNIYAHNGMKIYTQATKYIELAGMGIKVNDGEITYNKNGGYFQLNGNLLVTGGITAFADSGAGNQWIMDADELSEVDSDNQYKVYSAKVTTMLAEKVVEMAGKLEAIKNALSGISGSSSATAIGGALKDIYEALSK